MKLSATKRAGITALYVMALATSAMQGVWAADEVSTDSTCGNGKMCPEGSCCSWWGYCGTGEMFCGATCLSQCQGSNGTYVRPSKKISQDGSCDADTICPPGNCCSRWGYCGSTAEHCGIGCQHGCDNGPNKSKNTTTDVCPPPPPCVCAGIGQGVALIPTAIGTTPGGALPGPPGSPGVGATPPIAEVPAVPTVKPEVPSPGQSEVPPLVGSEVPHPPGSA
ncbi:hypothetical protein IWQ61_000336, partial [Dispira simplex]